MTDDKPIYPLPAPTTALPTDRPPAESQGAGQNADPRPGRELTPDEALIHVFNKHAETFRRLA